MYEEKKLVASGGSDKDNFGSSCSISGELVVIGAPPVFGKGAAFGIHDIEEEGAAYLFHLDGTEIKKLTHGNERDDDAWFGVPVSIDEKVVVATPLTDGSSVLQVFSRNGTYERTIRCDDCHHGIGRAVATLGNLIVTSGVQNSMYQLFILTTEGKFLKSYGQKLRLWLESVAISEQFIVSTSRSYDSDGVTIIYSNTSPDFPKIAEIKQGGTQVAVSNDRIVINDPSANNYDGAVYLYKTDGTLVKTLEIGWRSVDITDDKVFVGGSAGSVSIYSANTGEFLEKVVAPDGEADDWFGVSVCASDSHYVVGAPGRLDDTGAAYLFQSLRNDVVKDDSSSLRFISVE